jgi:CRP-like cAMP-binding protein
MIMPHTLSIQVFRSSPLSAELTDAQCEILLNIITTRVLSDGEILFTEGAVDNSLHGIYEGMLAVSKNTGGGDRIIIHTLKVGDIAGELGFLDGQEHSASLRAIGTTKVFSLERSKFEGLLLDHPEIVYRVMRSIVREVHTIVKRMNNQYVELHNYISKQHGRY